MPYTAQVVRVLIASPGDVATERRVARDIINRWNDIHGEDRSIVLQTITAETHAVPAMGERAQEIINQQLVRSADLLVGLFWTRLGTPTGIAPSGTVEEIREHLKAGKPAMLYFSAAPVRLDSVDDAQYKALREFREECRGGGLVEEYESIGEFEEKFARHLAQQINRSFRTAPGGSKDEGTASSATDDYRRRTSERTPTTPNLSAEAQELLREAAQDTHGTVLVLGTMGGDHVSANGRDFVEEGNPRSEARWRAAVKELLVNGYLTQRDRNGEVFMVSDNGYRVAEQLPPA